MPSNSLGEPPTCALAMMEYVPGTRLIGKDGWVYQVFMPRKIALSVLEVANVSVSPIVCNRVKLERKK